jgi:hypothetical protein
MQHIGYIEVQAAVLVVVSLDVNSLPFLATTTRYLYLSAGLE